RPSPFRYRKRRQMLAATPVEDRAASWNKSHIYGRISQFLFRSGWLRLSTKELCGQPLNDWRDVCSKLMEECTQDRSARRWSYVLTVATLVISIPTGQKTYSSTSVG